MHICYEQSLNYVNFGIEKCLNAKATGIYQQFHSLQFHSAWLKSKRKKSITTLSSENKKKTERNCISGF